MSAVIRLTAVERWDNFCSTLSLPARKIGEAAALVQSVHRIEIPRRIWAVLVRHPQTMYDYGNLRFVEPTSAPCPTCGAVRQTVRPLLDSKTIDHLLMANNDGPILPGSVVLTDSEENAIVLYGAHDNVRIEGILDLTNTGRYAAPPVVTRS